MFRLTREYATLLIRVIARKRAAFVFRRCGYRAAVGRRERRWQLNYYRDMHREYLIGERGSCVRALMCVYVACTHGGNDRPIAAARRAGQDDKAGIDSRICKPASYRSASRRLVNRGPRLLRLISGSWFIGSRARWSRDRAKQWIRHIAFAYRLPSPAIIHECHRVTLRKYTFTQKLHVCWLIIKSWKRNYKSCFSTWHRVFLARVALTFNTKPTKGVKMTGF